MPAFARRLAVPVLAAFAASTAVAGAARAGDVIAELRQPPPLATATAIPPGRIEAAVDRLDALAEDVLQRTGIPGLAIAVVHGGETIYARGFGVREAGGDAPVDADTVFQIASLSKSVGATVVAGQVGDGVVDWTTPVVEHLPWFELSDSWVTEHLTIGDLYAHRSGLPDHAGDDLEDLGSGREEILRQLRLLPLGPFRSHYAYTNFGIMAAAEAVAAAASMSWEQLSEETLYRPLGMTSTSSRHVEFMARDNRATGHALVGGEFRPLEQRQPDAQTAAGGVSSSVHDMARWMGLILGNGSYRGERIVAADALLPAITPRIVSGPAGSADARAGFYGYGFNVGIQPTGRTALTHSGAFALGAATSYLMIPSADLGIVILSNAAPVGAVEGIGMTFADLVQYGTVTRDWIAGYGALMEPLIAPVGELVGVEAPADPEPPAALESYTGTYGNAYFGPATVAATDGQLMLTVGAGDVVLPLAHWNGDTFTATPHSENFTTGSVTQVVFDRTADAATSLWIELFDENGFGTFERRR